MKFAFQIEYNFAQFSDRRIFPTRRKFSDRLKFRGRMPAYAPCRAFAPCSSAMTLLWQRPLIVDKRVITETSFRFHSACSVNDCYHALTR